jgi:electron transport complex protein RnfG
MTDPKLRRSLVIFFIVLASTVLLSATNTITSPIIQENKVAKALALSGSMFPEADRIEDFPDYKKVYHGDKLIGYLVESSSYGYSSEIRLLVGFLPDKTLKEIRILEQQETPGLGSKITEGSFMDQFKDIPVETATLKKDGGEIDAVTGATKSTKAVIKAVSEAVVVLP